MRRRRRQRRTKRNILFCHRIKIRFSLSLLRLFVNIKYIIFNLSLYIHQSEQYRHISFCAMSLCLLLNFSVYTLNQSKTQKKYLLKFLYIIYLYIRVCSAHMLLENFMKKYKFVHVYEINNTLCT